MILNKTTVFFRSHNTESYVNVVKGVSVEKSEVFFNIHFLGMDS